MYACGQTHSQEEFKTTYECHTIGCVEPAIHTMGKKDCDSDIIGYCKFCCSCFLKKLKHYRVENVYHNAIFLHSDKKHKVCKCGKLENYISSSYCGMCKKVVDVAHKFARDMHTCCDCAAQFCKSNILYLIGGHHSKPHSTCPSCKDDICPDDKLCSKILAKYDYNSNCKECLDHLGGHISWRIESRDGLLVSSKECCNNFKILYLTPALNLIGDATNLPQAILSNVLAKMMPRIAFLSEESILSKSDMIHNRSIDFPF